MFDVLSIVYLLSQPFRYLLGPRELWSGINAISSISLCNEHDFDNKTLYSLYLIYYTSFFLAIKSRYNLHYFIAYINYAYIHDSSDFIFFYTKYILMGSVILRLIDESNLILSP